MILMKNYFSFLDSLHLNRMKLNRNLTIGSSYNPSFSALSHDSENIQINLTTLLFLCNPKKICFMCRLVGDSSIQFNQIYFIKLNFVLPEFLHASSRDEKLSVRVNFTACVTRWTVHNATTLSLSLSLLLQNDVHQSCAQVLCLMYCVCLQMHKAKL